jgi:hypothetical protein
LQVILETPLFSAVQAVFALLFVFLILVDAKNVPLTEHSQVYSFLQDVEVNIAAIARNKIVFFIF